MNTSMISHTSYRRNGIIAFNAKKSMSSLMKPNVVFLSVGVKIEAHLGFPSIIYHPDQVVMLLLHTEVAFTLLKYVRKDFYKFQLKTKCRKFSGRSKLSHLDLPVIPPPR